MTFKARQVLADCKVALELLEEEADLQRWRIHWAAAVALIRAVGHVLHKVDGTNPDVKRAAAAAFKRWTGDDPAHDIFRDSIELERNSLLKEYHSDVHPLESVGIAVQFRMVPAEGGDPIVVNEVAEIDENIYRPLVDGPWAGNDARDVLSIAIAWWETELNAIDTAVRDGIATHVEAEAQRK